MYVDTLNFSVRACTSCKVFHSGRRLDGTKYAINLFELVPYKTMREKTSLFVLVVFARVCVSVCMCARVPIACQRYDDYTS